MAGTPPASYKSIIVLFPLGITDKVKIIKMYTQNYSTKDIARATSHAPSSVDRYIRDFQRVNSLSENLVNEYIEIVKEQVLKN